MADDPHFISRVYNGFKDMTGSPLVRKLLYGAAGYGLTRALWDPITRTVSSLSHVFMPGQVTEEDKAEIEKELQTNSKIKKWAPWVIGGLTAMVPTALSYNPRYGVSQLWSDHPDIRTDLQTRKFQKGASFEDLSYEYQGYIPDIDFNKVINAGQTMDLFTEDPFLNTPDFNYERQFGTSVVASAAQQAGSNNVTMGSIWDSAKQKFDSKLSLGGVANVATKAVVSNVMAGALASAIGAMTDLSPKTKQTIIDTGTWAGTIAAILE